MMMVPRRPRDTFADSPVGLFGLDVSPESVPPRPATEPSFPWEFVVVSSPRSSQNDFLDDEVILPDLSHVITPVNDSQPRLRPLDRGNNFEQTMRPGRGELTGLLTEVRLAEAKDDYACAEAEWNEKIKKAKEEARKKIEALVDRQRREVREFDSAHYIPIVAKTQFVEVTNATSSTVFKGKALGTQRKPRLGRMVSAERQKMIERHKHEILMANAPCARELRELEQRKMEDLAQKQAMIDEISAEMGMPQSPPPSPGKVPKPSCRMRLRRV